MRREIVCAYALVCGVYLGVSSLPSSASQGIDESNCFRLLARSAFPYRDIEIPVDSSTSLQFSPDSQWAVIGTKPFGFAAVDLDHPERVLYFRREQEFPQETSLEDPFRRRGREVRYFKFAGFGDSERLAVFFRGGDVELWNFSFAELAKGQFPYRFERKLSDFSGYASMIPTVSENGELVFGARKVGRDGVCGSVLDLSGGWSQPYFRFRHRATICGGTLSPRGDLLALTKSSGFYAYALPSGRRLPTAKIRNAGEVIFSNDGSCLAVLENANDVNFFDTRDLTQPAWRYSGGLQMRFGFSPDGRYAWVTEHTRSVVVYDRRSRKEVGRFAYPPTVQLIWPIGEPTFSPDGKYVATFTRNAHTAPTRFEKIRIWSLASNEMVAELPPVEHVSGLKYSPDGRKLVFFAPEHGLRIFDLSLWEQSLIERN